MKRTYSQPTGAMEHQEQQKQMVDSACQTEWSIPPYMMAPYITSTPVVNQIANLSEEEEEEDESQLVKLSPEVKVRVLRSRIGGAYLRIEVKRDHTEASLWSALKDRASLILEVNTDLKFRVHEQHHFVSNTYEGVCYFGVHLFTAAGQRIRGGWNLKVEEFKELLSAEVISQLDEMMGQVQGEAEAEGCMKRLKF